jgi:cytochrome c-type protein NapC
MTESTVSKRPSRWHRFIIWGAGLALVGILAVGAWVFITSMLAETAGASFCDACHTMDAQTEAYLRAPHGGNNRFGFQAKCVDCHLPHDSPLTYVLAKGKMGFMDVWTEFVGKPDGINWLGIEAHPQEYVYNSGCLSCHTRLLDATKDRPPVYKSHKAFFEQMQAGKNVWCIDCHPDVGHAREQNKDKPVARHSHKMFFKQLEAGKDVECIECHSDLGDPSEQKEGSPAVQKSHKAFFEQLAAGKDVKCIECHSDIGQAREQNKAG